MEVPNKSKRLNIRREIPLSSQIDKGFTGFEHLNLFLLFETVKQLCAVKTVCRVGISVNFMTNMYCDDMAHTSLW